MQYHVFFDISQTPYHWWWPALGLVIVGVGLLLLFFQKRRPGNRQLSESQIWIAIVGALVWTVLAFIGTYATYRDARTLYQQGHYALVEGQVEHFLPDTPQSKAPESFDVQGVHF